MRVSVWVSGAEIEPSEIIEGDVRALELPAAPLWRDMVRKIEEALERVGRWRDVVLGDEGLSPVVEDAPESMRA